MLDSIEIVNRLTKNGRYANEICLLLLANNQDETLEYLNYLNITGIDLETLYYKCCFEETPICLAQTVRYLRAGFLNYRTIFLNLRSTHPVHFIDRLLNPNEDWEHAYEHYTYQFFQKASQNNSR